MIYEKIAAGQFPLAKQVSTRVVAWPAARVLDWMEALPDVALGRPAEGRGIMEYVEFNAFPGSMFNAEGVSLDATTPDLTEKTLVEYPHRSMVARDSAAPIARVWLLADDATFAAVNPVIATEAIELVLTGKAIVILGRQLEPAVDVRDGLLDALDQRASPDDVTSQP